MAEFQWWLLVVGLVAGGGLVAVVMMDGARRDQDVEDEELPAEVTWIERRLDERGAEAGPETIEAVLLLHREYLGLPPPDALEPVRAADDEPHDVLERFARRPGLEDEPEDGRRRPDVSGDPELVARAGRDAVGDEASRQSSDPVH